MTGPGLSPTTLWGHVPVCGIARLVLSLCRRLRSFPLVEDCGLSALDGSLQNVRPKVKRQKMKFSLIPQQPESTPDVRASWAPALTEVPIM